MRRPAIVLSTLLATLALAPVADARDTRHQFEIATAIAAGKADGTLDGTVQFHFKGARAPAVGGIGGSLLVRPAAGQDRSGDRNARPGRPGPVAVGRLRNAGRAAIVGHSS